MDSPLKNGIHHGQNGVEGNDRLPKKPKLSVPITSAEIADEFAHHDPSVARINNGSFGSCPSSVLSAQSAWQRLFLRQPDQFYFDRLRPAILRSRLAIRDLISADDVEEVSIVDNATTAAAIVLQQVSWAFSEGRFDKGDAVVMLHYAYGAVKKSIHAYARRAGGHVIELEALYPGVYKNVHEYGNKYCKGGAFGLYQGASNHEELHNLMKATVMIRRLKKDVLSELPVKRRQQVFLDLNEKDMKQIRALFRELETVKNAIQIGKSIEDIESLKIIQKNLINKIYTESAEAKIPAVIDYLGTVIEAGIKFLIFAHHQPMINSIHQFLLKKKVGCIRIDGGTPPSLRQALVTDFQEKEDIRAAVLSIKAGGVGLTLTAASTVIFAELSWTPGDIIQAEDRAHRIGQVSSVNVHYLLANDTVDDIIWDVVQSKLENLGQMLDGHENTLAVSVSQMSSSPGKQATLDSFLKRCGGSMEEEPSRPKYPRN
ncbi:DNA helicase INO80 [Acorus calamus]|uniref:DNA helicase INO80 n=1 Tax=Acorus calamus TaxID=4465 RepID=A0AAV9F003_ACOCL|nr:DNA helicase INO80 [Acorus calamus]